MTDEIQKPDDRLTITLDGEQKELFMSSGMLRILSNLVSLQDDLTCIFIDPLMQERCLLEVLTPRDELGQPTIDLSTVSLAMYDLSIEESDKVVKWMGEHTLHFFTVSASSVSVKVPEMIKKIQDLTQSLPGLEDSAT